MQFKQASQYENPEPGSHIAICFGLVDLGTQPHAFQDRQTMSRDVRLLFELPLEKKTGKYRPEDKGQPFVVGCTVKQSLHPKARLRKLLAGWRGRDFTQEELAGFDPKKLIGAHCRVALVESPKGDFINIDSLAPLSKADMAQAKKLKASNAPLFVSLEPDEYDQAAFDRLSDKTKEKISTSPEYAALFENQGEGAQPDAPPEEGEPAAQAEDDDVPF